MYFIYAQNTIYSVLKRRGWVGNLPDFKLFTARAFYAIYVRGCNCPLCFRSHPREEIMHMHAPVISHIHILYNTRTIGARGNARIYFVV